jgi:hypothetical protein
MLYIDLLQMCAQLAVSYDFLRQCRSGVLATVIRMQASRQQAGQDTDDFLYFFFRLRAVIAFVGADRLCS